MAMIDSHLGPFRFNLKASRDGVGLQFGLGGPAWNRLYRWLSKRRTSARDGISDPAPDAPATTPEAAALLERIAGQGWYHTIDLGHGVRTKGEFDHTPHLDRYALPARLDGKRVLDVGSFDGFWSFEFERRGAAQVVAWDAPTFGDIDFPPPIRNAMPAGTLAAPTGSGFALAADILGSKAERITGSVYEMTPARIGLFDMSHIGNVLVHLRDPALALQRLAAVTRGESWIVEAIEPELGRDATLMRYMGGQENCNWWRFSEPALLAMVRDAGFATAEVVARFAIPLRGSARDMPIVVIRARTTMQEAPMHGA